MYPNIWIALKRIRQKDQTHLKSERCRLGTELSPWAGENQKGLHEFCYLFNHSFMMCCWKKSRMSSSLIFLICICPRSHWVLVRIKYDNTVIPEVRPQTSSIRKPGTCYNAVESHPALINELFWCTLKFENHRTKQIQSETSYNTGVLLLWKKFKIIHWRF